MFTRADLVDSFRERWRFNDREDPAVGYNSVRDQGEALTPTTDFNGEPGGIIALTSEAGEPLTVHFQGGTDNYPEGTLTRLLTVRGPLETSGIDLLPLASIYSNFGMMAGRRPILRPTLPLWIAARSPSSRASA